MKIISSPCHNFNIKIIIKNISNSKNRLDKLQCGWSPLPPTYVYKNYFWAHGGAQTDSKLYEGQPPQAPTLMYIKIIPVYMVGHTQTLNYMRDNPPGSHFCIKIIPVYIVGHKQTLNYMRDQRPPST